ncbi:MAG: hypothetical protein KDD73_07870 [Anaerolineales bacterium]|nr:hypothetical protein [Anaerolineales bacterium]MCB9127175.1 hypothetical protein [Ardenticatenales bacterium]
MISRLLERKRYCDAVSALSFIDATDALPSALRRGDATGCDVSRNDLWRRSALSIRVDGFVAVRRGAA